VTHKPRPLSGPRSDGSVMDVVAQLKALRRDAVSAEGIFEGLASVCDGNVPCSLCRGSAAKLQCERCCGSGRERVPVELLVKVALELFRIRHESMKPGPDVEALKKGLNSRSAAVRLVAWRAILARVLDGPAEQEA